jgi:tripartite ATP-independent transporter DctM subunit
MELFILLGSFIILLLLGVPVASAMILSAFASLWWGGLPVNIIAERTLGGINSYTLLAVPFFIFAAVLMNRAGLSERLLDAAKALVGHFRGGTAQVDVLASIFFAGMSGSATADAASQGRIIIPSMVREGYTPGFAAGVTAASSTIGAIIPPSIAMIIYGAVTNISVGTLFVAGVVPGIVTGVAMMVYIAIVAGRRGYPSSEKLSWRAKVRPLVRAIPSLLAPVIILGSIILGVATPTEAGVVACVYALFLGVVVYREIKLRDLYVLLVEAVEATAIPVFIIAAGTVFGFALTIAGFGFIVRDAVTGFTADPLVFLIVVVAIFFVVGLFVEGTTAMLIFVPVFAPMVQSFAIDPLQFALIVIVTIMIGTITPPVGLQLYVTAHLARISIFRVEIWGFVAIMMLVVVAMMFVPGIVTYVPGLMH